MNASAEAVQYRVAAYGESAGFLIPVQWPISSDPDLTRRAPVLDQENRNRVVRYVGYRRCLICKKPFWSEDIKKNQLCDGVHAIQD